MSARAIRKQRLRTLAERSGLIPLTWIGRVGDRELLSAPLIHDYRVLRNIAHHSDPINVAAVTDFMLGLLEQADQFAAVHTARRVNVELAIGGWGDTELFHPIWTTFIYAIGPAVDKHDVVRAFSTQGRVVEALVAAVNTRATRFRVQEVPLMNDPDLMRVYVNIQR